MIENVTDIGWEGTVQSLLQKRTYRTLADPVSGIGTSLGNRWFDIHSDMRILNNPTVVGDDGHGSADLQLRMSANETIMLKHLGSGVYSTPPDWDFDVRGVQGNFLVRDKQSQRVYVFYGFGSDIPGYKQGRLKSLTNSQSTDPGFTSTPVYTTTEFVIPLPYDAQQGPIKGGGGILLTGTITKQTGSMSSCSTASPPSAFTYQIKTIGGVNRITSVSLWSGAPSTSTLLQQVVYKYQNQVPTPPADLGGSGDLIEVKTRKRDSAGNFIERYTHYRYYPASSVRDTLPGILKAVYEHDAIQQMLKDGGLTDPSSLLQKADSDAIVSGGKQVAQYASRSFKYSLQSTENVDTSNVVTAWSTTAENLNSTYGNSTAYEWDEVHELRVKSEDLGGSACGSCSATVNGRVTKDYYYIGLDQGYGPDGHDLYSVYRGDVKANHVNEVTQLVVEDTVGYEGSTAVPLYRTIYGLNDFGRKLREIRIAKPLESDGNLKCWCQAWIFHTYDMNGDGDALDTADVPKLKHRIKEYRPPSAYNVTTAAGIRAFLDPFDDDDTNLPSSPVNGKDGASGLWAAETSAGIFSGTGEVTLYDHNNDGRLTATKVKQGVSATTANYVTSQEWGDGSDVKPTDRIVKKHEYPLPTDTVTHSSRITTDYAYEFWDDDDTAPDDQYIKKRTTTHLAIPTSQNGSNVPIVTEEYFDVFGRLRWYKDGEGYVSYYAYAPVAGGLAYTAKDVDPSVDLPESATNNLYSWDPPCDGYADENKPSARGWNSDSLPAALSLVSTATHDHMGRVVIRTDPPTPQNPDGAIHYTAYQTNTLNGLMYRETTLPYWGSSAPFQVKEYDSFGRISLSYELPSNFSTTTVDGIQQLNAVPLVSDYLSLTRFLYDDSSRRLKEVQRFHHIDTSQTLTEQEPFDDFAATHYLYDVEGNIGASIQDVDSGRYQVKCTIYDVLGRAVEARRGVSTSVPTSYAALSATLTTTPPSGFIDYAIVSKTVYDDMDFDGDSDIGDGHVTRRISVHSVTTSGQPDDYSTAIYHRTFRGHIRGVTKCYFDGSSDEVMSCVVQDRDWLGRGVDQITYFSEPTWTTVLTGIGYTNYVSSHLSSTTRLNRKLTKYDARGRVYQQDHYPAGDSFHRMDYYYDRNGAHVASGGTNNAHTEFAYDGAGRQYQTRTVRDWQSTKYNSSTGKFQYVSPAPKPDVTAMTGSGGFIVDLKHQDFDAVGNNVAVHEFELRHGNSTSGIDFDSDQYFVRRTTYQRYDGADRLSAVADYGSGDTTTGAGSWKLTTTIPAFNAENYSSSDVTSGRALLTTYQYDSAGRLAAVTNPMEVETRTFYDDLGRREFVAEHQVDFEGDEEDIGGTNNDEDRVTKWQYNGLGRVKALTAFNGSSSNAQVTRYLYENAYNARLVTNMIYPDSDDDDSSDSDQVKIAYDIDGMVTSREDQRETVISYSYNKRRQLALEDVTTVGDDTDGSVRAIKRSYDSLGRLTKITSYSGVGASGTVLNEVQSDYDGGSSPDGTLVAEWQSHQDAVNTSSSTVVQYTYDTAFNSNGYIRGLRLNETIYPAGRKVKPQWESATSYGTFLHRADMLQVAPAGGSYATIVRYRYNGADRLISADFETPDIRLQFYGTSETDDDYDRFDRFGRPIQYTWESYSGSVTAVSRSDLSYDRTGNVLIDDGLATSQDQKYTYDDLSRLVDRDQGSAPSTWSNAESWTLDQLGNWSGYDYASLSQSRYHNEVNEIEGNVGNSIAGSGSANWADPAYDDAGNMTAMPEPITPPSSSPYNFNSANAFTLKYDAWNRLVTVKRGSNFMTENEYDGLGRRIVRSVYSSGSLSHRIHYYYNKEWQLVEERKEVSGTESANPLNQYVWHPYYIDALAVRWYDANTNGNFTDSGDGEQYYLHGNNYSVRAVTSIAASILERYSYTSYGECSVQNSSYAATNGFSAIGNTHLYTGRERNPETGLQINRHRYYAGHLGRWLTRDPIGYLGGTNLYNYVINMPLRLLDPIGFGLLDDLFPPPPAPDPNDLVEFPPPLPPGGFGPPPVVPVIPPPNPFGQIPPCPKEPPATPPGGGWCREGDSWFHPGTCYRSVPVMYGDPGAQCCYYDDGSLVPPSDHGGTPDVSTPAEGVEPDGSCNWSFPGWVDHCIQDVIPYFAGSKE